MFDITAMGELLIDFTPAGLSDAGNVVFERNPGGAPANVLVALSKLGGNGAFIGKVGNDQFGIFLKNVLERNNVHADGLRFSKDVNTTLAFVHLDKNGDRSFSFYRNPGADLMLSEEEVDVGLISSSRIFHFGSLSMTDEPARSATLKALKFARDKGILISYDPNWRPPLWKDQDTAREWMRKGLSYADILKVSEEELSFLTGETEIYKGIKVLYDMGIRIITVTMGDKGCTYHCPNGSGHISAYNTKSIDTTGAGDAFVGALLYRICRLEKKIEDITLEEISDMVDFSNAVGALCITKKGAIPAMPTLEEVRHFMKNTSKRT